jgi:hypothetical protein
MSTRLQIDEERWPRVYVTWPPSALTDEEFTQLLDRLSGFVRRGKPFVIIHDGRKAVRPTPSQRSLAARHQKDDAEYSHRWLRASALVVSNPVIAGVVTAVNWIFPPPFPQKIFSSIPDAEAWAEERLNASGG